MLRMKDFQPNAPVVLAFSSLGGKDAPDNGYGPAVVFATSEGSMYLPPDAGRSVADAIAALCVQPGETVHVVRRGRKLTVERPLMTSAARSVPPPPAPWPDETIGNGSGSGNGAGNGANAPTGPERANTAKLMSCFMSAIDAISEAQAYADRRGLKVTFTSEDVRATAISCW